MRKKITKFCEFVISLWKNVENISSSCYEDVVVNVANLFKKNHQKEKLQICVNSNRRNFLVENVSSSCYEDT